MEFREAEEEADLHIDHEDGAPPVDTAVPIAGGERESVEAFLLRLGLKDLGGWRFETIPDKKRVGKVNYIASNLKATCQIHRDCSLYASLRTVGDEAALRHLVSWLHGGHADKVDRAEHAARAAEMKISVFGMKLRGRAS